MSHDEQHVEITHMISNVLRMIERAFAGKVSLINLDLMRAIHCGTNKNGQRWKRNISC